MFYTNSVSLIAFLAKFWYTQSVFKSLRHFPAILQLWNHLKKSENVIVRKTTMNFSFQFIAVSPPHLLSFTHCFTIYGSLIRLILWMAIISLICHIFSAVLALWDKDKRLWEWWELAINRWKKFVYSHLLFRRQNVLQHTSHLPSECIAASH